MNRIEKYNIIKQEIDRWDPVGLLSDGAPESEYNIEITKISSLFIEEVTEETLAQHIHDVFLEMFDESTYTKAKNIIECKEIAKNILDRINN